MMAWLKYWSYLVQEKPKQCSELMKGNLDGAWFMPCSRNVYQILCCYVIILLPVKLHCPSGKTGRGVEEWTTNKIRLGSQVRILNRPPSCPIDRTDDFSSSMSLVSRSIVCVTSTSSPIWTFRFQEHHKIAPTDGLSWLFNNLGCPLQDKGSGVKSRPFR